jgi:hypothetical protein
VAISHVAACILLVLGFAQTSSIAPAGTLTFASRMAAVISWAFSEATLWPAICLAR